MSDNISPTRVRYTDRQFLQAADLQTDQSYHRAARWRHNLALHSWGILAGLEVSASGLNPLTTTVNVTAGMALDGYGRELVIQTTNSERQPLNENQSYDVWLVYREDKVSPKSTQPSDGCATTTEAVRVEEKPRVLVTKTADRRSASPSRPDCVPVGDLDFGPDRPAPPPERGWPVFLARLDFRADDVGTLRWLPDTSERQYAGLVADRITAPLRPQQSARTVIINGADPNNPTLRFAVATCKASESINLETNPPFIAVHTAAADSRRIELRSEKVTIAGDMVFRDGSAIQFAANPVTPSSDDVHAQPLNGVDHWRMYHHFTPPEPRQDPQIGGPPQPPPRFSDELRITMPSVPAGANQVVIGFFGDKGKFEPVLAVREKSVEVYGTLRVIGGEITGSFTKLPAGAAQAGGNGAISPDALKTAIETFLRGGGDSEIVLKPTLDVGTWTDGQITEVLNKFWEPRSKVLAGWIFDKDQKRAGDLVQGMPAKDDDDKAIKAFADELWKKQDQLKTLLTAILENVPKNDDDQVLNAARNARVSEVAELIADKLVNVRDHLGMKAIGKKLPDADRDPNQQTRETAEALLAAKFKPLVEGLLVGGKLRSQALVAAIFNHGENADPVSGKWAVASALGHKLPVFPNNPTTDTTAVPAFIIPIQARLRNFIEHLIQVVKDGAGTQAHDEDPRFKEYTQLMKAIKVVAKLIPD